MSQSNTGAVAFVLILAVPIFWYLSLFKNVFETYFNISRRAESALLRCLSSRTSRLEMKGSAFSRWRARLGWIHLRSHAAPRQFSICACGFTSMRAKLRLCTCACAHVALEFCLLGEFLAPINSDFFHIFLYYCNTVSKDIRFSTCKRFPGSSMKTGLPMFVPGLFR